MPLTDIVKRNILFVSTAAVDEEKCREFCTKLESANVYYWSMHRGCSYLPTTARYRWQSVNNFDEKIRNALGCASIFVLLISKNIFEVKMDGRLYVRSEIQREIEMFQQHQKIDEDIVYMPIRLFEGDSIELPNPRDNDILKKFYLSDIEEAIKLTSHGIYIESITDDELIIKIMEQSMRYQNQKVLCHIEDLKISKLLLNLQNECIQKTHITNKISDYILTSGELASNDEFAEIHILSNELRHYDCTMVSTLAIAVNIQRGMKYVYYIPDSSLKDLEFLKERIRKFVKRDVNALSEIDIWLRDRLCEEKRIDAFIDGIFMGRFVDNVPQYYSYLPESSQNEIRQIYDEIYSSRVKYVDKLKAWIKSSNASAASINYSVLGPFVDLAKRILQLTNINGDFVHYKAKQIYDAFELVVALYDFSGWLIHDVVPQNVEELLEYLFDDDVIDGISQIRSYIVKDGDYMVGESHVSESDIEEFMNNVIHIPLSKMRLIEPCYSFCLYIRQENDRSIAWYTCHSNAQTMDRRTDEYIVIYAPSSTEVNRSECDRFTNAFLEVINHTEGALDALKLWDSKLLRFM